VRQSWGSLSTQDEVDVDPLEDVNEDNYEEFITKMSDDRLVVVEFQAEWCAPCKKVEPLVRKLALAHPYVTFGRYQCDKSKPAHPKSLGISSFPAFLMYRNGQKIGMLKGSTCVGELMSIVGNHNGRLSLSMDAD